MRDHSLSVFVAASVAEGITFMAVRDSVTGPAIGLGILVPGALAAFAMLAFWKSDAEEDTWTGGEVGGCLTAALLGSWAPILLSFVLGAGAC